MPREADRFFATVIPYDLHMDVMALFLEARRAGYSWAQGPLIEARGRFLARLLVLGVSATRRDVRREPLTIERPNERTRP